MNDDEPRLSQEAADYFRTIGFALGCFAVGGAITLAMVLAARWMFENL